MRHVVLASMCGLASVTSAQSASLSIVPSLAGFEEGGFSVFTLSIFAEADFGTHISGGEFGLVGTNSAALASDMTGTVPTWAGLGENDRGYAGNGDYTGLVFGQLIFPPFVQPAAESSLALGEVLVGIVMVTVPSGSGGFFSWETVAGQGDFMLEIYDEADGSFTQLTADQVGVGSASVLVPGAPSGALLGIAGLVACRRRR